jgi:hypothetical protein
MNIFNRIIMIIIMLGIIVFSVVAIANIFFNLFEWSSVADRVMNYVLDMNRYILAAIIFLVLIIALIILIFEFHRKKTSLASVSADSSGKTMVTLKSSASQIRESLNNVQDIINPQVKVSPKQNGIIINIFSKLVTGVNVADKTKEIREAASNFASNSLGFKVLQTNYTATGFVARKEKEAKVFKEEEPVEIISEEDKD